MEQWRTVRNVAIVVAIGAGVYLIPGGGRAANGFEAFLLVMFGLGIAYLCLRQYRERQLTLMSLGDRHRGILYGSVALGFFCYMGRSRMWESGFGELVWFLLVALAVWGLMEVYRQSRSLS
jgi:hypothetical protein